jgi:predicted nuclease of predicted toxin-antitoxin system
LRFLADESCDFAVVRALRAAGHDVTAVAEFAQRSEDAVVADLAVLDARILLTEDKDFGQLVYARAQPLGGVILLRFPAGARSGAAQAVLDLIARHPDRLNGSFIVLSPRRMRIRRLP